ncbi:MAG: glycosyltransferase [Candidatus Iainarchaeum archaeon]|uniref:Glycosyltransferase n=1 Tax=Candidatus Iainarchaeum sp. TaxID=3101447 RepID=A0A7T9DKU2_9ARCH|nr:MAG: glycosyltransferase [Candidatus Diapherotrites archaeon]
MPTLTRNKLLLTCSAGGHLTEMRQLFPFYSHYNRCFVTFKRPDTESLATKERVHFIERPARNPISTIQSFFQAWRVVSKEKPSMVISTGADVTVPVCIAAKLQGIPIVFIESFCRPYSKSWTGRIMQFLANDIIYQWPQLKAAYPRGIYAGNIFTSEEVKV